jgi:carboxymethylenebutenolidase
MIEEDVEIRSADGTAGGVLYRAQDPGDGGRRAPGVIFLTDLGGIRPSQRGMAGRLAAAGYTVLMPNIFYRLGEPPMIDLSPGFQDEGVTRRFTELKASLPLEAVERDASAYVDFLAAQDSVGTGGMGVVGFCFGGGMALRFAAARPDRIAAAASFHGGGLVTDEPTSPYLLLPRLQARLYFGHATQDRGMPAAAIEKLDRALAAWGGRYESEIYEGALHGWTVPDSPVYDASQAERAFQKLTELFAETLRGQAQSQRI